MASENIATKPAPQLPGADQHAMAPHRALKGTPTNPFRTDTGA